MAQTIEKINDAKLTHVVESTWESQKQAAVDESKKRLKNSVEVGMAQVQDGEHAPLDEAYKKEIRSLV